MLQQREIALQRLRSAQNIAEYMEMKVRHYEDILAGQFSDDTNPATSVVKKC